MNPFRIRDGSPWLIERSAYDAMSRAAREPRAGLVPGQSPAQPPPYPDRETRGPGYDLINGVAVIPVYGVIYAHSAFLDDLMAWAFGGVSIDALADALRCAVADPAARSILFSFDSPGGKVARTGEMAGLIRAAGSVKPVAAYCEFLCCSGAYYLACACGEITAAPSALIGSIGVVLPLVDDSKFQETIGILDTPIVSSQSPDKWPDVATPEGRALYQRMADDMAGVFVADVARYRGVPASTVLSDFGKGGVMIASDAKRAGMIDKVGTFDDTLSKLSGPNRARLAVKRSAAISPANATISAPVSPSAPMRVRLVPQRA